MPVFPSREWCEEFLRLTNEDPDRADAAEGWTGDFGAVVLAEPGRLDKPFVVHVQPEGGRLSRLSILEDPDELEDLQPAYFASASYSIWKGLLRGTVDPLEAVLLRRLVVRGDLQQLAARMKYKGMARRVLTALTSEFVDDQGHST